MRHYVGGNMMEIGPEHRVEYREEVLAPFFRYIQSADSFYVVGAASMGKTRLLDHLMRPDVQKYHLKENAEKYWLIRVDLNRMPVNEPAWSFYELLVSSILLNLHEMEDKKSIQVELIRFDSEIIQKRDPLIALRLFEYTVNKLCQNYDLRLAFLFDEFDEAYKTLPRELFMQLRAVRDANKNRVSFVLFMRHLPESVRSPNDIESFYELLSRNPVGIGPFKEVDGLKILQQLEARKQHPITEDQRRIIYRASGGHPGLMQALLSILIERPLTFQKLYMPDWPAIFVQEPAVKEECRKIWGGLLEEERQRLPAFLTGEFRRGAQPIDKLIQAKGLIRTNGDDVIFFSPLFAQFVENH